MVGKLHFVVACFVVLLVQSALSQCPWNSGGRTFSSVFGTPTNTTNILIAEKIILDSSNLVVNNINITNGGELVFRNSTTSVWAHLIFVGNGGKLTIGTPSCRISAKIEITLWGARSTANEMYDEVDRIAMGTKGIGISSGGAIDVHGLSPQPAWTRLSKHAVQNETTITLRQSVNWNVGDEIIIASTDYPGVYLGERSTSDPATFTPPAPNAWGNVPMPFDQNERRKILSISGDRRTITLDAALNFTHYGLADMSAEVGVLTRNVLIQGDDGQNNFMGGHIMIRNAVYARFTGVELFHMGQKGIVGRYPIHFHLMGDTIDPANRYIKDSATHDVFQRCIVIHTSHGVMVQNNVAYNAQGHCYFLEDGPESFNTFDNNLGILANPIYAQDPDGVERRIIVADAAPSIFWIVNPNNTVTNNVAVEAQNGFWYAMPDKPVGISVNCCEPLEPRRVPLLLFKNNVAHSTGSGLFVDKGILPSTPAGMVAPKTNYNPGVPAYFDGFIAYKNRDFGVWTQSENIHVINAKLYDNKIAARMIAGRNSLQDSIVAIDTDNLGVPPPGRIRSRPLRYDSELLGWQYYDHGSQSLRNVTFTNFVPANVTSTTIRQAAAIQFPCQPHPHNAFMRLEDIKFVNSVEFRIPNITTCYVNNFDNLGAVHVMDVDGSVTGWVGGWIVSNLDIHKYEGCVPMPQWQFAAKCPPTFEGYVRTQVNAALADIPDRIAPDSPAQMTFTALEKPGTAPLVLRGDATKSGDVTSGYNFASNLHNTRAYLVRWLSNSVSTRINLRMGEYAQPGESVLLVFPYPKSATFSFVGQYTQVNSLNDLVLASYFYDSGRELLYVRLSTEEEANNGNPRGNWAGWAHYSTSSGQTLTIMANCSGATFCRAPASNAVGFTVPLPTRREQLFRGDLTTCSDAPVPVPYRSDLTLSGSAYVSYDPRTSRLMFHILHNVGLKYVTSVWVEDVDSQTQEFVLPALPVSPVKGFTYLSRSSHKKLVSGKLRIVVGTGNSPRALTAILGCVGTCSLPEDYVDAKPCDAVDAVNIYVNGNFSAFVPSPFPTAWITGSSTVGSVTPFFNAEGVCGSKPIQANLGSSAILNIGVNGGSGLNLDVQKYRFFEFWVKADMPNNGQVDLFVTLAPTPGSAGRVRIVKSHMDNHAISKDWQRVRIAMSEFNATTQINFRYAQISVVYTSNARPTYYFDQFRFSSLSDPARVKETSPPSVAAYAANQCEAVDPTAPPTNPPGSNNDNAAAKSTIWTAAFMLAILGALVF